MIWIRGMIELMVHCEIVEACMLHTPISLGALSLIMVCKVVEHHRISDYLKDLESGGDRILLFACELVMRNDTLFRWMK